MCLQQYRGRAAAAMPPKRNTMKSRHKINQSRSARAKLGGQKHAAPQNCPPPPSVRAHRGALLAGGGQGVTLNGARLSAQPHQGAAIGLPSSHRNLEARQAQQAGQAAHRHICRLAAEGPARGPLSAHHWRPLHRPRGLQLLPQWLPLAGCWSSGESGSKGTRASARLPMMTETLQRSVRSMHSSGFNAARHSEAQAPHSPSSTLPCQFGPCALRTAPRAA